MNLTILFFRFKNDLFLKGKLIVNFFFWNVVPIVIFIVYYMSKLYQWFCSSKTLIVFSFSTYNIKKIIHIIIYT